MIDNILDYIQISDIENMSKHILSWGIIPHTNHIMHAIAYHMIMKGEY